MMNDVEFTQTLALFEATGAPVFCERRDDRCGPLFLATKSVYVNEKEIHLFCDAHAPKGAVPLHTPEIKMSVLLGQKPPADAPIDAAASGLAKLRSKFSGQFGVRLRSTVDQATTHIIMQTLDASPTNPYLVTFDQFILDPFTGPGQFDLVERDAGDVDILDAESGSPVTLATHSDGFTDGVANEAGWSRFIKPITADKIYGVVFVPGTAGDGAYSISARALIPLSPDQTPLPS